MGSLLVRVLVVAYLVVVYLNTDIQIYSILNIDNNSVLQQHSCSTFCFHLYHVRHHISQHTMHKSMSEL